MQKVLEDFYYGNITPSEKEVRPGSKLHRAVDTAARCESQLTEGLDEVRLALLTDLVRAQHEIDSITALENFILGFRLGARMMSECMDDNDGDVRNGGAWLWQNAALMARAISENAGMVVGRAAIPQVTILTPENASSKMC